jgi:hypothetical protein
LMIIIGNDMKTHVVCSFCDTNEMEELGFKF